jgi:ArsR family transcriptional regulator
MSGEAGASGRDSAQVEVRELRQYFRALSGTLRLRLVRELAMQGEMSVSQLVAALRVSQPLVSWHLSFLKRVGLVRIRRTGRQVYCSLDRAQLQSYQDLLATFLGEPVEGEATSK